MFLLMRLLFSLVLLSLLAAGCTSGARGVDPEAYTDTVYAPTYASGFAILRNPATGDTLFAVTKPWQHCDSDVVSYIVAGQDVNLPLRRLVTMSTTHIAMLDAVGGADAVVGVSGYDFISTPSVHERLDRSADVGYDGNVDYETVASLHPDLVLLYGVSSPSVMESKLRDLRIPYIYIGDYVEESPLGKAEWMVFLGEFTGHGERARQCFASVAERYEDLRQLSEARGAKPKVMVNLPYQGSWFMPSQTSYVAQLVHDAGGELAYVHGSDGSVSVDLETAYMLADSADVWINAGAARSLSDLLALAPKFGTVKPVREGRVYNCMAKIGPNGGNDYFESGTVNPDLIISDLHRIFYDAEVPDTLNYYVRLK